MEGGSCSLNGYTLHTPPTQAAIVLGIGEHTGGNKTVEATPPAMVPCYSTTGTEEIDLTVSFCYPHVERYCKAGTYLKKTHNNKRSCKNSLNKVTKASRWRRCLIKIKILPHHGAVEKWEKATCHHFSRLSCTSCRLCHTATWLAGVWMSSILRLQWGVELCREEWDCVIFGRTSTDWCPTSEILKRLWSVTCYSKFSCCIIHHVLRVGYLG